MTDEMTWVAILVNVLVFAAGWGAMFAHVQQARADIKKMKEDIYEKFDARLRIVENKCLVNHGDDHK